MRALILSDIHSNIDALDAVLSAAPPHDVVWNLGDVVGYNAAPVATIERVRGIGKFFVRGNHDRACSGLTDATDFNPIALAAVQWTRRQLDPELTQWLREIPRGPVEISAGAHGRHSHEPAPADALDSGAQKIACVHGSALDEDEYLLSLRDAAPLLANAATRLTFFGHTHIQGGFAASADGECVSIHPAYSGDDVPESYDLDLRPSATYLINPGSVGQPRDRDWRAAFALYDDERERVTFWRVPYDVRLAQMRIQRAGLPDLLASRLRAGR